MKFSTIALALSTLATTAHAQTGKKGAMSMLDPTVPEEPAGPQPITCTALASGEQVSNGAVDTMTGGTLVLEFPPDFSSINFSLTITDGTGITEASLRCGDVDSNFGDDLATLFMPTNPTDVNGPAGMGTLTSADISSGHCGSGTVGNPIQIYNAIQESSLFFRIDTNSHSQGEAIGRFLPVFCE